MRNIITTALVALVVGSLAGASAAAIAQTPAESRVEAAASGNADRVDGRHAVGASASKAKRANKLVATNRRGQLPANIIRRSWASIADKPAALADGQIRWGEVGGKPAGFADGTDDAGVTALQVRRVELATSVSRGSFNLRINCPSGSFVVGGGFDRPLSSVVVWRSYPSDGDTWRVAGTNGHTSSVIMRGYATCLATKPAGAISGVGNY
jgi:hypothetical protein